MVFLTSGMAGCCIQVPRAHDTAQSSDAHLEIVDVNVETTTNIFAERVGEFLVGFAQLSMLGVLEGFSVFVAFAKNAGWLVVFGLWDYHPWMYLTR
jgi:hypothetical protein